MSLRVALALTAICAATPLAAAEAPVAQSAVLAAGLGGSDAAAMPAPGPGPDQDLVPQPGFFESLPPALAAPPAAPARDRRGRAIQPSAPVDALLV